MRKIPVLLWIVLLAACSGGETPTATPLPNPTIQITGDLTASVEADNYYVAPVKGSDESVIGTMLYLNQDDTRVLFIRFPKDAPAGTYPINMGFMPDNFDGTSATGNYIDQTGDDMMQFSATGGTLTLDSAGVSYSGSYQFTAQDETGKQINLSGSFTSIPSETPSP